MDKFKDTNISQLIPVMGDQLAAYKELLDIAEKKTDILIKGDVKLLGEITELEQSLILKMGKLEEERFGIVLNLAKEYNKDAEDIKPDLIKGLLPREDSEAFSKIYEELKEVLKQVGERNKTNGKLIQQVLEYINFSIDLLTDVGETKTNYSPDGTSAQETIHFIDKKA